MSSTDVEISNYAIGARVLCDNFIGTLKYVGCVDGQQGVWLGIEWDDVSRGKHDGSVAGKQYFQASHPTSASFVRPKKADFGRDFLHALEDKYGPFGQNYDGNGDNNDRDNENAPSHDLLVLNMKDNKAIAVDLVGGDRVVKANSNWSSLFRLALDRQRVNGINLSQHDPQKLTAFSSTTHLLLRANLVSTWSHIGEICSILPKLQELDVSENRIAISSDEKELQNHSHHFRSITALVMHKVKYNWDDISTILNYFPQVQSLGLSFNVISSINIESNVTNYQVLTNLTFLDLVGNSIKSWDEVLKLGFMTSLKELHLDECGLTDIYFPGTKPTETTSLFPALQYLTIDFNRIDKWRSISELAKLPSLRDIRLRHNPVYNLEDITRETARQLVIARLLRVKSVNGSVIFPEERRGSEIDYVNHLVKRWHEAAKSQTLDEFEREHPTFELLVDRFKLRKELLGEEIQDNTQNSAFIEIGFVKFGNGSDKPIMHRVSSNVVIAKLKLLAKRVLKLPNPAGSLTLSYQSLKNPKLIVSLDKDSKELSFFSIENGDTVVVAISNN